MHFVGKWWTTDFVFSHIVSRKTLFASNPMLTNITQTNRTNTWFWLAYIHIYDFRNNKNNAVREFTAPPWASVGLSSSGWWTAALFVWLKPTNQTAVVILDGNVPQCSTKYLKKHWVHHMFVIVCVFCLPFLATIRLEINMTIDTLTEWLEEKWCFFSATGFITSVYWVYCCRWLHWLQQCGLFFSQQCMELGVLHHS